MHSSRPAKDAILAKVSADRQYTLPVAAKTSRWPLAMAGVKFGDPEARRVAETSGNSKRTQTWMITECSNDVFTKPLSAARFQYLQSKLLVHSPPISLQGDDKTILAADKAAQAAELKAAAQATPTAAYASSAAAPVQLTAVFSTISEGLGLCQQHDSELAPSVEELEHCKDAGRPSAGAQHPEYPHDGECLLGHESPTLEEQHRTLSGSRGNRMEVWSADETRWANMADELAMVIWLTEEGTEQDMLIAAEEGRESEVEKVFLGDDPPYAEEVSAWVLDQISEVRQLLGVSFEGHEDEAMKLFSVIEESWRGGAPS
ncbi:hypothetical protein CsSME_00038413 [Camellia sinensis var. sinensis]